MARVRVTGLEGSISFLALLDTGADATLFPQSIADAIGIKIDESRRTTVSGIGGEPLIAHTGEVKLELITFRESIRWKTQVGFASFTSPEHEVGILGMTGALDLFVATFDGEKREVELKPTSKFHRWQETTTRSV